MIDGMTKKLAISLPDELAEQVAAAVRHGRVPSASAYIAKAIEAYEEPMTLTQFFEEWRQEVGPSSPDEKAWARAQLDAIDRPGRSSGAVQ
jgi:Arc/MetJ-type ribon-helix-helix transcriptional regulator